MPGQTLTAPPLSSRRFTRPTQPGAAAALHIAGLCVLALALVWAVAELIPSAQIRDAILLHRFTLLSGPHVDAVARVLLNLESPALMVCWGLALIFVALARGRPREALAAGLIVALAPLAADTLKPLLAHPHVNSGGVHGIKPGAILAAVACPSTTPCSAVDHSGNEVTFNPSDGSSAGGGTKTIDSGISTGERRDAQDWGWRGCIEELVRVLAS